MKSTFVAHSEPEPGCPLCVFAPPSTNGPAIPLTTLEMHIPPWLWFRHYTGRSLLHIAYYGRYPVPLLLGDSGKEFVRLLLKHGANIDEADNNSDTVLLLAVKKGSTPDSARFFIEQGADMDIQDADGNTALHIAAQQGMEELLEFLLNEGADRKITNSEGKTPCQVARDEGHFTGTPILGQLCRP